MASFTHRALGQVTTVQDLAKKLRRVPLVLEQTLVRAVAVAQETGRSTAVDEVRQHGIGRSLWGWPPKSARKRGRQPQIWVPPKPRARGGKVEGVIAAYGLAAMIELGGRTMRHVILGRGRGVIGNVRRGRRGRALKAGVLAFQGSTGPVVVPYVKHPGGPIPKRPYLQLAQAAMTERFVDQAEAEMQFALDHAIG